MKEAIVFFSGWIAGLVTFLAVALILYHHGE